MEDGRRKEILDKIDALMNTANDSNDAEGATALSTAVKLMAKYGILETELGTAKEEEIEYITTPLPNLTKHTDWLLQLAVVISENTGTYSTVSSRGKKSWLVTHGTAQSLEVFSKLFDGIQEMLRHKSWAHQNELYAELDIPRSRAMTSKMKKSYCLGYVEGLYHNFQSRKEEVAQEYGLVVQTSDRVIEQATRNINPDNPGVRSNNEVYTYSRNKGREDGMSHALPTDEKLG